MKPDEYKYLADTLSGRRQRDPEFESRLSDVVDSRAAERQRQLDSKTVEERELEQREFSLTTYGKAHMEKYSTPIVSDRPLGRLQVPGDQIKDYRIHSGDRDKLGSQKGLKSHSGLEPEPWQNPDGSLRLQTHGAIRQVLKLI